MNPADIAAATIGGITTGLAIIAAAWAIIRTHNPR